MKKLLPIFFLFLYTLAHGQSAPKSAFSAGLDLAIPTNSIYNVGLGASLKAEIPITSAASITVTAGYTSLYYKKSLIGSSKPQDAAGFAPLKAGVKYYLSEGFFIEGETGVSLETNYSKNTLFAFSLGPGFLLPVSKNTSIELGFRYENWGSGRVRQTGIRVAYHFVLGE